MKGCGHFDIFLLFYSSFSLAGENKYDVDAAPPPN
jgi:hypothetical protein